MTDPPPRWGLPPKSGPGGGPVPWETPGAAPRSALHAAVLVGDLAALRDAVEAIEVCALSRSALLLFFFFFFFFFF